MYKARWHGSYVAAKILKRSDEIALGDFRTEIAILRKISHPNCVQVLSASCVLYDAFVRACVGLCCVSVCVCGVMQGPPRQPPHTLTRPPSPPPHEKPNPNQTKNQTTTKQFLGACTKQKPYVVLTELMACSLANAFNRTYYAPTPRRQVEIALDFARGMAYLHSRRQPIVHRDLKPACVVVFLLFDRALFGPGLFFACTHF